VGGKLIGVETLTGKHGLEILDPVEGRILVFILLTLFFGELRDQGEMPSRRL
jgi:hypothetical protein